MGLYDYTVYNVIQRNARIQKDRVAWISGDEKISHLEFLKRVDSLAFGLLEAGLKHGDRIGVLSQNCMEYVYLYGAAAKIGAVMLPINWRLQLEEVEYVISDGEPKIFFAGSEFQKLAGEIIPKFDFVKNQYAMGPADGYFAAFNGLMENDGVCPEVEVKTDDPYVIIHTAAVAGRQRGATLSHGNLITADMQCMYMWHLTNEDCHLLMLPLFHIAGLSACLSVMQAGGKNIILPKFDADQALQHIHDDKVSIFVEFPPMLTTLLDRNEELKLDISSLRILGGLDSPETVKRYEELSGGVYWTAYGQSETTGFVALAPYFEKPGSAGLPAYMADVEIVDPQGEFVEPGAPGEIVVRGPMVFKGYWNLDKDNEYTFRDGWHHTGDMGRFDEDGYLWYAGRMPEKELIKPGGENVYPSEVEKVILEHPAVMEAAVIGVPDKQWGEAIKAVCVLKQGESLEESELIEFVAARIARFKKPKHVVFVSELPKAEDGSIDRTKVKEACGQD
ncbi:MAG: long-chain fatty acid--CoA ligase [Desulfobacteraceae bacterium]|nr:MAG: long-chain fatty acid--CoA ligase [Desulfobacteraceae bacterium]